MGALLNRARMTTATTGTGTITLGSALAGFATFAEAGASNATAYSYCIEDGQDFEIGVGTYTVSGTTFTRDTVTLSKIAGTAGTSKINLSGSATIFVTALVSDIGSAFLTANTFTATQTITPAANTSALVSSGGSLTGSNAQSLIDLAGTWNTTGTPTAFKVNVTDTASNAASLLMDLQAGGTSMAKLSKEGVFSVRESLEFSATAAVGANRGFASLGTSDISIYLSGNRHWSFTNNILYGLSSSPTILLLSDTAPSIEFGASSDTRLTRDAANTLAQRNGTNAQILRVYNTFTDASNHERAYMRWTSNVLEIGAEAAGTGTQRAMRLNASVATPAAGSANASICLGTTATFGIYYGSGAPTVTAAQGSLYLRSDGSSTSTRLYVNTDGATTWTNFTSAA